MARYRVGDSYLSEDEYEEYQLGNWTAAIFIITSIVTGYFVNSLLLDFELQKTYRFILVFVTAMLSGYVMSLFSKYIRILVGLIISLMIIVLIGAVIWSVI